MKHKHLINAIKWIWIVAVVGMSSYFLISHYNQVEFYFQKLSFINLIGSLFFLTCGKLILVIISKYSVESEGEILSFTDIFCIVSLTQLAKYIPGSIWHFVSRYGAYNNQNITFKKTTRALISENLWLVSGAFLTGSLVGILSQQGKSLLMNSGVDIPIIILASTIIMLWFAILFVHKRFFIGESNISIIKILGVQIASWLCLGVSFTFVMPNLSLDTFFLNISAYLYGWLVGYLAIFAPGGIGIRESALVWLLSGVISPENAIIYTAVHRLLFFTVELLFGAIATMIQISKAKTLPA